MTNATTTINGKPLTDEQLLAALKAGEITAKQINDAKRIDRSGCSTDLFRELRRIEGQKGVYRPAR